MLSSAGKIGFTQLPKMLKRQSEKMFFFEVKCFDKLDRSTNKQSLSPNLKRPMLLSNHNDTGLWTDITKVKYILVPINSSRSNIFAKNNWPRKSF